jgi:photosystem II stability/assembly factor-like uncharacterized protein
MEETMRKKGVFVGGLILFLLLTNGCSLEEPPSATPTPPRAAPTPTLQATASQKQDAGRGDPTIGETTEDETPVPTREPAPIVVPENPIPRLEAGQTITIRKIYMANAKLGWAIAAAEDGAFRVMRTDDGGSTFWDASPPAGAPEAGEKKPADGFFLDEDRAWVSYQPYEVIWYTQDGGASWHGAMTNLSTLFGVRIWFEDANHGWVMKTLDAGMSSVYIALFRTTNGGASWEALFDPYTSDELQSFSKTGMVYFGETGWVTRDSYGVSVEVFLDLSQDGGRTWEKITLNPPSSAPDSFTDGYCGLASPTLFSDQYGVFVLNCKSYSGDEKIESHFIYETQDGGATWTTRSYVGGELVFVDRSNAYALGRDIHRSQDGGQTWTKVKSVHWDGDFTFVDADTAWAVARANDQYALVHTSDGCQSFEEIEPEVVPAKVPARAGAGAPAAISGQIGFLSYRDNPDTSTSDIYLVNSDGSGLQELTDSSGRISNFSWSPDGSRIVFDSNRDEKYELYIVDVESLAWTQLTDNDANDADPAWSPDGSEIAFVSTRDGDSAIYIMDVNGGGVRKLTEGQTPAWSPDGSRTAFSIMEDGMFVINNDGSGLQRLTDSSEYGYDWHPAWSPDGSKILFGSNRQTPGDYANDEVYVMNADGTGVGQLTFSSTGAPPYAWSSDGTMIAYTRGWGSGAKLYVMDGSGMNQRPLMENNEGSHPLWRP